MQVKIFEAPDMATGLRQVRKELGPDALILSTRTIKDGKMGLLGKKYLEITAAVDHQFEQPSSDTDNSAAIVDAAKAYALNSKEPSSVSSQSGQMQEHVEELESKVKQKDLTFTLEPKNKGNLEQEFTELKEMVQNLAGQISKIGHTEAETVEPAGNRIISKLEQKLRNGKGNSEIEEILLDNGVNNDTAKVISTFASEHFTEDEEHDKEKLYSFLQETVAEILTVEKFDFVSENQQRRIALIGPTGVGKTTTIAKIAAKYLAQKSNSIAFITIDTYRIAAVEQLKVYGEIMRLPVEVVLTPQQLKEALEKHHDKELILIDTAGRSPRDSFSIEELETFFTAELNIENHLVLSATTRDNELIETLKNFGKLPLKSTIFTKIDECVDLGVILNIQAQNSSPLTYITNGQRVPEDIVEADNNQLAQLIIPSPNGVINE